MTGVRPDIVKNAILASNRYGLEDREVMDVEIRLQHTATVDDQIYLILKPEEEEIIQE